MGVQGVRAPFFGPRYRLFNIVPKVGPPPPGPPFLFVDLRWSFLMVPFQKILDPPLLSMHSHIPQLLRHCHTPTGTTQYCRYSHKPNLTLLDSENLVMQEIKEFKVRIGFCTKLVLMSMAHLERSQGFFCNMLIKIISSKCYSILKVAELFRLL